MVGMWGVCEGNEFCGHVILPRVMAAPLPWLHLLFFFSLFIVFAFVGPVGHLVGPLEFFFEIEIEIEIGMGPILPEFKTLGGWWCLPSLEVLKCSCD